MFHNLSPAALGITGRQSELIELALTFGFGGLNLELPAIVKRAQKDGQERACRFLVSAGIQLGVFPLPIDIAAPEAKYRASLGVVSEYASVGQRLRAFCCQATLSPDSGGMPYHECFELHRARLREIAEMLAPQEIRLGVAFRSAPALRTDVETPFIHDGAAAMTLVRSIGHANLGLVLDTWDWFVSGGTLEQLRQIPVANIAAVNLADVPGGVDLSMIDESARYLPVPGGLVDCRAVVQYLRQGDFAGPLTLLPAPARFVGMTRDAIVQLARATYKDLLNPTPPLEAQAGENAEPSDRSTDNTAAEPIRPAVVEGDAR